MACSHHSVATEGTQAGAAGAGSLNLRAPTGPLPQARLFHKDDTTDLPGANQRLPLYRPRSNGTITTVLAAASSPRASRASLNVLEANFCSGHSAMWAPAKADNS